MSSLWALVAYRNFSKAQKLTPEDGVLSGFESEIEVLKCMSDLYKNQKLDSDFIEGLGAENPSNLDQGSSGRRRHPRPGSLKPSFSFLKVVTTETRNLKIQDDEDLPRFLTQIKIWKKSKISIRYAHERSYYEKS